MSYANNKGADQPAHPRSLISTFIVRCLGITIPILTKISRLWPISVAEHAGLSLTWSQASEDRFSRDVPQIIFASDWLLATEPIEWTQKWSYCRLFVCPRFYWSLPMLIGGFPHVNWQVMRSLHVLLLSCVELFYTDNKIIPVFSCQIILRVWPFTILPYHANKIVEYVHIIPSFFRRHILVIGSQDQTIEKSHTLILDLST